jgi:hypothetical protein
MVTKDYRKGVYEWVEKSKPSSDPLLGPSRNQPDDFGNALFSAVDNRWIASLSRLVPQQPAQK